MNCRETRPLLPLFLDGELDARQVRGVALHSTRCTACEQELQRLERLQDLVGEYISSRIEDVDLSRVWAGVATRLEEIPLSWASRMRARWDTLDVDWRWPAPALAALAAAAALLTWSWLPTNPGSPPEHNRIAAVDNSASLDLVESHVDSMALLSEPETNTMVLWLSDDESGGGWEIG